jgi:hypothetical protein
MTREVIYLNEKDRPEPKKALKFTDWFFAKEKMAIHRNAKGNQVWADSILDDSAKQYAAYLATFSAEEKGVEFQYWQNDNGHWIDGQYPVEPLKVVYRGNDSKMGDLFDWHTDEGIIPCKGKLNNGKY